MVSFKTPQVVLFTADIERAVTFYKAVGFREVYRVPTVGTPLHVELAIDGYRIGLGDRDQHRDAYGLNPVVEGQNAAVLLWVDDAQAGYDRLLELGATPVHPPKPTERRLIAAWVEDPDGNLIEVVEPTENWRV